MPNITLTAGNDSYTQPDNDKNTWYHVEGLAGNDTIRLYNGVGVGGPGNDRIEGLIDPANPNRTIGAAYWSGGDNVLINLGQGWADDGQGGRDTLINVTRVWSGSAANHRVIGGARDEYHHPGWGTDTFEGGAGNDGVNMNSGHIEFAPGQFRHLVLDEINIVVSADGRNATFTPKVGPTWSLTTIDVEYFDVNANAATNQGPWAQHRLADFITPQTMAQQTLVAGGTLRWNAAQAMGSAATVSYSFVGNAPASGPGATGFRTFTEPERQFVRDILAKTALITNLTFTEVTESGSTVGQMRFGVSQQTASKGVAYLPNQSGAGDAAGDVWMDRDSMAAITVGSEGYQALLHEIGHALGLRHPRNSDPGDNWAMQLIALHDKQTMTVMSGTPTADGLFRSDWGPLDVLALRHLYGTRNTGLGDTVYTLGANAGNFEQTLTDDGGIDTLNASALATGVQLTLVPGGLSNVGFSSNGVVGVDNLAITAGTLIEHAVGTAADDELIGNDADNRLTGGLGNDWIDGGKGTDTAVFAGPRSAYEVDHAFGLTYVKARDGTSGYDTLVAIERIQFADQTLTVGGSPLSEDVNRAVDEDTQLAGTLPTPSDLTSRTGVTWSLLDGPAHGSASVAADGSFSYTPAANYWGGDSFGYRVSTSAGNNAYRVYVNVKPINDGAPVGRSVALMVPVGAAYEGQVPGASDADGDPLTFSVASEPEHGALDFADDGRYTYTPAAGFVGDDAFGFAVSDGMGGSNRYTVTLRVGLQTLEDTALATLLPEPAGVARSAATYTLVSAPAQGAMAISAQGALSFTPAANAHGNQHFAYDVAANGNTTRITVDLRVLPVNDGPPVASNASYALAEDGRLEVALPAATDPDGPGSGSPVYAIASTPRLGSATVAADGRLVYQPRADAFGSDSLTYTVADSDGLLNTYSVALTVNAVNDAPRAADIQATVQAGQVLYGLLPTADDTEGDPLLYLLAAAPAKGQLTLSLAGRYSYTPNAGAESSGGSDSFRYTIIDGEGGSVERTVHITIRPAAAAREGDAAQALFVVEAGQQQAAMAAVVVREVVPDSFIEATEPALLPAAGIGLGWGVWPEVWALP